LEFICNLEFGIWKFLNFCMNEIKNANIQNIVGAIEAILFSYGEPMDIKKIAKMLDKKEEEIKSALNEFEEKLKDENRGLKLVFNGEQVQLVTKPEFSEFLEEFIKEEFKEISPKYNHENMDGEIEISVGEYDYIAPSKAMQNLARKMKKEGKNVKLSVHPHFGHVLLIWLFKIKE